MQIKCDFLVVGAGPAGLSAARAAAKRGLKTILIEEHDEIGVPVQCGEGIGEYLFPLLPFKIPDNQLIWKTDGMLFWSEEGYIERIGEYWKGYSVDRERFDKWLARVASKEGAEIWTKSRLVDMEIDNDKNVENAIINSNGRHVSISPKVVIGADGCESTVLKLLGLYDPKKGDLAEVYSWEMKGLNLYNPHLEEIFIGDFTPRGYAYIFPKGKTVANVGVGGLFPEKKIEMYFDEFLDIPFVKKQIKNGVFVKEKSKKAVWNDLSDKWIIGNVVLAGDAANQNLKPFIEGILPSLICGDIAGNISFEFISGEKPFHENYFSKVRKKLGEYIDTSFVLQKYIFDLFSSNDENMYLKFFGIISQLLELDEIKNLDPEKIREVIKKRLEKWDMI